MKTEVEVKFLNIGVKDIRKHLHKTGATCVQPMRIMRRITVNTPEMARKKGYLRVRDEGDKVTVTYKQFDALAVDGAKEIEIVVDDFEATVHLLAAIGLKQNSFQETKRETWELKGVEVVIDEWPWLNPYVEIEGKSEAELRGIATELGFSWADAMFGDVMVAYRAQYPHLKPTDNIGDIPEAHLNDPVPQLLWPTE